MTAPVVSSPLAFLHDDASLLHDLYDASDGLPHLAAHAGAALEGATPQDILRWASDRFGQRFVITSSMGDAVLTHLASTVSPGIRVLFLDTGYHFAETLGTADAVSTALPIDLVRVRPHLCCAMRKVAPLTKALAPYVAWGSGIRRDESEARADIQVVAWDEAHHMVKINPLAAWTQDDVDRYIADNNVIVNPLVEEGYASIGCAPCTRRGEGRTGRWLGLPKVECGLHA
jgi:phosphoadenosine phosphosulfate reductase